MNPLLPLKMGEQELGKKIRRLVGRNGTKRENRGDEKEQQSLPQSAVFSHFSGKSMVDATGIEPVTPAV